MAGKEGRLVILVRHGPYENDPKDGKSFWQENGKLDIDKFDVKKTVESIKQMIEGNGGGYTLKEVRSTTLSRAVDTAELLSNELGIETISSSEINPNFKKWEDLNNSAENYHSIMTVSAMYKDDSPSKPLLQEEGHNLQKYVGNMLKEMEDGDAIIVVSHSPLIEALQSALNEDWDTIPVTLKRGGAKGFLFAY